MKKLIWYSLDSIGVYPNFYVKKESIYSTKKDSIIQKGSLFKLEESKYDGKYWVYDIYGKEVEDPEHLLNVEIVEINLVEIKNE